MAAPGVPTDLTVTVLGESSLRLSWTAPSDGDANTRYNVRSRISGETEYSFLDFFIEDTSYDFTDLYSNSVYDLEVQSRNLSNESSDYVTTTGTTDAATEAPFPPINFDVQQATETTIGIYWEHSVFGGGTAHRDDIRYRTGTGSWTTISGAIRYTYAYFITGLTKDTLYEIQVRARNAIGTSEWGYNIFYRTDPTLAPSTPINLSVETISGSTVRAEWDRGLTGDTPSSYQIQYRPESVEGIEDWDSTNFFNFLGFRQNITDFSYDVEDLVSLTTYEFQIRARNIIGTSNWTSSETATTTSGFASDIEVIPIDNDTLRVVWDRPSTRDYPTSYDLRYKISTVDEWTIINDVAYPYDLDGLIANTTYEIQIRTIYFDTINDWSPGVIQTTLAISTESRVLPLWILNVDSITDDNLPEEFSLYRSDRSIFVENWVMEESTVQAQTLIPYSSDTGPSVHERTRNLVEENMVIYFEGKMFRENIRMVERLIETANNDTHNIYLAYDSNSQGSRNLWRSPIISGVISLTETTQINLVEEKARMNLRIVREPWWEEHDIVRTVFIPRDDISSGDLVLINGDNIQGTIPSPVEITIEKLTPGYENKGMHIQVFQDEKIRDRGSSTDLYSVEKITESDFSDSEENVLWFTGDINPQKFLGSIQWYNVLIEHN